MWAHGFKLVSPINKIPDTNAFILIFGTRKDDVPSIRLFLTVPRGYAFNGNQSKPEYGKILIWF